MPVFEYRCGGCGRRFSALVGMTAGLDEVACPHCGSREAQKLVSRFVRGRNEDARMEEISDHLDLLGEPDSPTEIRGLMREVGKAMDEDVSDEMEEMFESDMEGDEP